MCIASRTLGAHHILGGTDVLDSCLRISAKIGLSAIEHVARS